MRKLLFPKIIFFSGLFLFFSCTNIIENNASKKTDNLAIITFVSTEDKCSRTILPGCKISETDLKDFVLIGSLQNGYSSEKIYGNWDTYSEFSTASITVEPDTYIFTLTANGKTASYQDTITAKIKTGVNQLSFNLSSSGGTGNINIQLYFSNFADVKIAKAGLFNQSMEALSGYEIKELHISDTDNSENNPNCKTVTYTAENVPAGTYYLFFYFYSDTASNDLINVYPETVVVKGDELSSLKTKVDLNERFGILYDLNGGTWESDFSPQLSYTPYENISLPPEEKLISPGYSFDGWYLDNNFTEKASDWNAGEKTGAVKLYAKWDLNTYTITYELNGGISESQTFPSSYTIENSAISLPTENLISKTGFKFAGWYTSPDYFPEEQITEIKNGSYGNIKLYALWAGNYSISYDLMWASGVTNPNTITEFTTETENILLQKPVYSDDSFIFDGWYTKFEGGVYAGKVMELELGTGKGEASTTLYARWTRQTPYTPDGASVIETSLTDFLDYVHTLKTTDELYLLFTEESFSAENITAINKAIKEKPNTKFYLNFSTATTGFVLPNASAENYNNSFYNCRNLTGITLPETESFTYLGQYSFYHCDVLKEIVIPDSVNDIGYDAFNWCSSLEKITTDALGGTATSNNSTNFLGYIFGSSPFTNSEKVEQKYFFNYEHVADGTFSFYIPKSLSTVVITGGIIKNSAFYGCSMLKNIYIDKSITSIPRYSFCNTNIENVYYNGTVSDWVKISFENSKSNPCNSRAKLFTSNDDGNSYELLTEITENTFDDVTYACNCKAGYIPNPSVY